MDQTITLHPQGTPTNSGYALLIGVDHYDTLGSAAELSGSRNDVLMWHWFCRQHLGIPAENIRMLTSPRLDPGKDFGGDPVPAESLGDASEASIRAGYAWLLERMNGGKNPGLLAYSGHGLLLANGRPALSASDVTAGGKGGIPLQELGEAVSKASAQQMLTAIFDCCHVAAPASVGDLRTCTGLSYGAESAPSIEDEAFNVSHRVFLAASPGRPAYQGKMGRSVHGALSFALVTAAEQWKASQAPGQTGLDVNHKELFKRAKKLLRALRMKQSPKLRVPFDAQSRSAVRKMPFFGMAAGITARTPDAVRERIQTDPGLRNDYRVYTITDKAGDFTAYILVQNAHPQNTIPSGWGDSAKTEFWYINNAALSKIVTTTGNASTIQISAAAIPSTENPIYLKSDVFTDRTTARGPDELRVHSVAVLRQRRYVVLLQRHRSRHRNAYYLAAHIQSPNGREHDAGE